mmetsp:Transcript_57048/g.88768  ORF Transcript_57048/g.88768 Transcript_57048/m.88768 type:complete len:108 (-) Transcript_57048:15-338(-)
MGQKQACCSEEKPCCSERSRDDLVEFADKESSAVVPAYALTALQEHPADWENANMIQLPALGLEEEMDPEEKVRAEFVNVALDACLDQLAENIVHARVSYPVADERK